MNLAPRNLLYYWRGNLAVLLGVAVGAAVLAGALFVGDSLHGSLRDRAERQSGGVSAAWIGDKLLHERLANKLAPDAVPAMLLRGTSTVEGKPGTARVTVLGLDEAGLERLGIRDTGPWQNNIAIVSHALGERLGLKSDSRIRLTVPQLSAVPRGSLLGRRTIDDLTTTMSLAVRTILDAKAPANVFALIPSPEEPLNLFIPLAFLQQRLDKRERFNAMLACGGSATNLNDRLEELLEPGDWGLRIHVPPSRKAYVSVESEQLVLSPAVAGKLQESLKAEPTIVYLANWIAANDKQRIPYSIVAALDANASPPLGPFLPPGIVNLKEDEIVLTDWPESPLKDVPVGSAITLTFYLPEVEGGEKEAAATFKLIGRIPLAGPARDPDLTPPFPGITDKLKIGDWNPPFKIESSRITRRDDEYWEQFRTTPKAYISTAAGEKLFGSRFGVVTSFRIAPLAGESLEQAETRVRQTLRQKLDAKMLGIQFDDVSGRLANASVGGTDFGGLFLGFSLFLIVAALVLVGLLVRLCVERRARDIGGLLAVGFTPKRIRRSLLLEGLIVSLFGAALGVAAAVIYSRGLIWILTELWPDGAVKSLLKPHATPLSAAIGFMAAVTMAMLAIYLAVRGLVKLPIPALLQGRSEVTDFALKRRRSGIVAPGLALIGIAVIVAGSRFSNPDFRAMSFFGGGGLLFTAGILMVRRLLTRERSPLTPQSGLAALGLRNAGRFPGRSTLTVLLLGSATFLIVSVESFRRSPGDGASRFNLIAEADIPIFYPFDSEPGRGDFLDLYDKELRNTDANRPDGQAVAKSLEGIKGVVPLRRRGGDDASCLNLYQAARPRLIGVPAGAFDLGGFKFSQSEADTPEEKENPWLLLAKPRGDGAIPVIGEQNSVMWMLKKAVGDEIELPDETGIMRRFRIVATLQDSPFQSELLLSEANFRQLFPRDEGYSVFLIDGGSGENSKALADVLSLGYRSHGLVVSRTADRLAAYQAVIGTYLTTFQLLGGLGLLLGVLGLAVVVLRNVWERLGEFALLKAVGFSQSQIRRIVLAENLYLLLLGLGLGALTAVISVLPQGGLFFQQLPRLTAMLGIVLIVGTVVVILATYSALRLPIMAALRRE